MGSICSCFEANQSQEVSDDINANHRGVFSKYMALFNLDRKTVHIVKNEHLVEEKECSPGQGGHSDSWFNLAKEMHGLDNAEKMVLASSEDEDVCPTCFEEYMDENPKIILQCTHHYHLACIYEWLERSNLCPVCNKVMVFDETS